ncbi:MAG: class I SAM-dependent methyltransferase [Proteobacteria bacterium]|nr:class I SAM-dependent methyltransferase [Pseudomonadota bacterium]
MPFNPVKYITRSLRKNQELRYFRNASNQQIFTHIYEKNKWGDNNTRSGKGSNLDKTWRLRQELPSALAQLGVMSLLDIPCGDFFWIKEIDLQIDHYLGADIVPALITANTEKYGNSSVRFLHLDLLRDPLPQADAILCRECLVHFSFADARQAIANIKSSGANHLLTTHFPDIDRNLDIITGKHRPLNMCREPFNWPEPVIQIAEGDAGSKRGQKCLSIWSIADLPLWVPGTSSA